MFRFTIQDLLWLTVMGLATTASSQELAKPTVISVASFGRENVIGHLGHPLGTTVRVTGICVDGDTTRRRADAGKTLLEIEAVNGRKLNQPIAFDFRRAANDISKPSPGQRFDYYAHEWGTFDGVVSLPKELGIQRPAVANDGFYYRREITVHKDNDLRK